MLGWDRPSRWFHPRSSFSRSRCYVSVRFKDLHHARLFLVRWPLSHTTMSFFKTPYYKWNITTSSHERFVFTGCKMHLQYDFIRSSTMRVEREISWPILCHQWQSRVRVCKITCSGNKKWRIRLFFQCSYYNIEKIYNFHKGRRRQLSLRGTP